MPEIHSNVAGTLSNQPTNKPTAATGTVGRVILLEVPFSPERSRTGKSIPAKRGTGVLSLICTAAGGTVKRLDGHVGSPV